MIDDTQLNTQLDTQLFSKQILAWFDKHGRKNLPWQQLHSNTPDPYPVWISEIMLQQTQVATVIDYFHRFMARFGDLRTLALADLDDVLALWAGLGYYARAKNLHKGARQLYAIMQQTGDYPQTTTDWQAISGVGRSTAGAIVAMGLHQFGVICDGNVKRVLTRHFGIDGDITKSATDKALWQLATTLTPAKNSGHYAQAMMDMGATVCTRHQPKCQICPVATSCHAHKTGSQALFPVKAKQKIKPAHSSIALMIEFDGRALWLKRTHNIWQNLWCVPLLNDKSSSLNDDIIWQILTDNDYLNNDYLNNDYLNNDYLDNDSLDNIPTTHHIRHTLTHFHWQIAQATIVINHATYEALNRALIEVNAHFEWLSLHQALDKPLPTGIVKLLQNKP